MPTPNPKYHGVKTKAGIIINISDVPVGFATPDKIFIK
jgi:hypothetical protein